MKPRLAIGAAALLLSSAGLGQAAGEPPIERIRQAVTGKMIRTQRWDVGLLTAEPANPTIADLYRHRAELLRLAPGPVTARVLCPIDLSGRILVPVASCTFYCEKTEEASCSRTLPNVLLDNETIDWPSFRVSNDRELARFAVAELRLDVPPPPDVDLSQGELVDRLAVVDADVEASVDYPLQALRAGAEGKMTMICQVQNDYSVICTLSRFDPPRLARYFEVSAMELGARLRAKPQLSDGSSTIGKRFEWSAAFDMDSR